MSERSGSLPRIDVHHHMLPPVYRRALDRRGMANIAGAPVPDWAPDRSLAVMDVNGIGTSILSVSCPGTHLGDDAEAAEVARACNEYAADLGARHPGRFGSFAVLPMPRADLAANEAAHALDVLRADGVVLLGSTRGTFLGDPSLEELMAELDRRSATVFVHPNLHATSEALGLGTPGFFVEFLCDTTRAAVNLILSGTLERYPNIRFILAHVRRLWEEGPTGDALREHMARVVASQSMEFKEHNVELGFRAASAAVVPGVVRGGARGRGPAGRRARRRSRRA